MPPDPYPQMILVGSAQCIERGEEAECPLPLPEPMIGNPCVSPLVPAWLQFGNGTGNLSPLSGVVVPLSIVNVMGLDHWQGEVPVAFPGGDTSVFVDAFCQTGLGMLLDGFSRPDGQVSFGSMLPTALPPNVPLVYRFEPPFTDDAFLDASIFASDPGPGPGPFFPAACFANNKPILQNPIDWLSMARIIGKVYDNDGTAQLDLKSFLPPGAASFQWVNDATVPPGMAIAWNGEECLVAMAGTTNNQQLALQIAYALGGPVNVGAYGTNPVWYAVSNLVAARISLQGVSSSTKITLAGHSYGAALAVILGATYKAALPNRNVRILTYGMPRPGDRRLADLVGTIPSVHLSNFADPVTALPPVGLELLPLSVVVPAPLYAQWRTTAKPAGQIIIQPDGTLLETDAPALLWNALLDAVNTIVIGGVLPAFTNHTIAEYVRRLELAFA